MSGIAYPSDNPADVKLAELQQRLEQLEKVSGESWSVVGPRTDLPTSDPPYTGLRVRMGLLEDGTYGLELWSETGTHTVIGVSGGAGIIIGPNYIDLPDANDDTSWDVPAGYGRLFVRQPGIPGTQVGVKAGTISYYWLYP